MEELSDRNDGETDDSDNPTVSLYHFPVPLPFLPLHHNILHLLDYDSNELIYVNCNLFFTGGAVLIELYHRAHLPQ